MFIFYFLTVNKCILSCDVVFLSNSFLSHRSLHFPFHLHFLFVRDVFLLRGLEDPRGDHPRPEHHGAPEKTVVDI